MSCPASSDCAMSLSSTLALGAGCYWGTEKFVTKNFQKYFPDSIKSVSVGFMNPDPNGIANPSYEQVCRGKTGHVEVLNVELTRPDEHYEELIRFFFQFHDPTTLNRQGNDRGTQYASYVFVTDDEQKRVAEKVKDELQQLIDGGKLSCFAEGRVETVVGDYTTFYPAHEEHQQYLEKNPYGYCNHRVRFAEWPELN